MNNFTLAMKLAEKGGVVVTLALTGESLYL